MAFATIDVTKGISGVTPVANGGTALSSGFKNGVDPRENAKPIIINGNMAVAQRGTSASGKTSAGYYACDRWNFAISSGGTWTVSQDTDVPSGEGFLTSMKYDCTTAESSLGSAAYLQHRQSIEGQNLQLLKKGTSNAEKITISFWVKATKTGTNILELFDNTNNRQVSKAYTVSSSDTWEKKVVNFPADTSGALANNNSGALNVQFYLGAGSNLSSGTLSETWTAYTNADRAVGQVNHADSTSNNFYITGVQLEVGEFSSTTLPPFQFEDFGDNLARCQRYYNMLASGAVATTNGGYNERLGVGYFQGSSLFFFIRDLPVPLRANPTIETVSGTNYFNVTRDGGEDNCDDIIFYTSSPNIISMRVDGSTATGSQGDPGIISINNTAARVAVTAEL